MWLLKPYSLRLPAQRSTSVIFASPHSGRDYPWSFRRRSVLDERTLRSSEDAFVDVLFDTAPEHGAPFLMANAPRAWVDVNRGPEELDPALIEGVGKPAHNPRIASGLGVIPRVVAGGRAIYRGKITRREAEARIRDHWTPWHGQLRVLMDESVQAFGEAILIDCHSMPHEAIETVGDPGARPNIVLGDRFGAAASSEVVDRIEAAFYSAGFSVARNAPFAGAFSTQAYGRPGDRRHVVQVEIDRALYLDEKLVRPSAEFAAFKERLDHVVGEIAQIGRQELPLAAE